MSLNLKYDFHLEKQKGAHAKGAGYSETSVAWSRKDVIKDFRFYLLLPAASAPSLVVTALFFHHLSLAELKNWEIIWFTGSYWIYALGSVIAMLATGPMIDRYSAVRVLPGFLVPSAIALSIVWAFDSAWWAWPYLFLLGSTIGIAHTGLTALWAEIYGVKNLGAIKSLYTSISVFASALGPLSMGILMDHGMSIETIFIIFATYCITTSGLLVIALRGYKPKTL